MAKGPRYKVEYKRRRQGKTNYKKRLNLLKSDLPRLVIRKTNRYIIVQLVKYNSEGDQILTATSSKELKEKFKWKFSTRNLPAAYLTGFLCGCRGKHEKIKQGVLDLGLCPPVNGSRIYSALKGVIDSGLEIPHSEEIFPEEKRIMGGHISEHTHKENLTKNFEESKKLIEKNFLSKKGEKKK